MKRIGLIATGGTIAGVQAPDMQSYTAGIMPISSLLSALRFDAAHIVPIQLANIDSCDMDADLWFALVRAIDSALLDMDGIVITHGTDTLEESAFLLQLLVRTHKPVVLTGANRPSNALGADGLRNLYNALCIACSERAHGVLVTMNDSIFAPTDCVKATTLGVDCFAARNGALGYVQQGAVHFLRAQSRELPHFSARSSESFARVEILLSYAHNGLGVILDALVCDGVRGVVIAGSGAGNVHSALKCVLRGYQPHELTIVCASRVARSFVVPAMLQAPQWIAAGYLSAFSARILLALLLGSGATHDTIARTFAIFADSDNST